MDVKPSVIEFRLEEAARHQPLHTAYFAIKAAKERGNHPDSDDPSWMPYFDDQARKYFWWPTEEEMAEWEKRWFSTPVAQRWTDPALQTGWLLESMIEAFYNLDATLGELEMVNEREGRILFFTSAWPFGGTACFRALVEAFGGAVTSDTEEDS